MLRLRCRLLAGPRCELGALARRYQHPRRAMSAVILDRLIDAAGGWLKNGTWGPAAFVVTVVFLLPTSALFLWHPLRMDALYYPSLRPINPNRKIFEARKRETAALGAGEKLVLGHPLAATIGDSARCMQNLEKVLFTGPKTSDTVTFICD